MRSSNRSERRRKKRPEPERVTKDHKKRRIFLPSSSTVLISVLIVQSPRDVFIYRRILAMKMISNAP